MKTTTPSNVVFKVAGAQTEGKTDIQGLGEAKYTDRKNGLTFTQAWSTANSLITSVELDNQILKGLKLDLNTNLTPEAGPDEKGSRIAKSAVLNAAYKQPGLHSRASLNVFKVRPNEQPLSFFLIFYYIFQGPTFTADAVLGHDGFLVGTEASYNVTSGKVTKYAAGVGFSAPEYAVTLLATDSLTKYAASYYHRVSRDVEAGGKAYYDTARAPDGVKLEVGTKA